MDELEEEEREKETDFWVTNETLRLYTVTGIGALLPFSFFFPVGWMLLPVKSSRENTGDRFVFVA